MRSKIHRLKERGVMREVSSEINAAHAAAMRRRRIPVDTGRLRGSLTQTNHRDRILKVYDDGVEVGTRTPYAKYQRHRIRKLTAQERREIFIKPIQLSFNSRIKKR